MSRNGAGQIHITHQHFIKIEDEEIHSFSITDKIRSDDCRFHALHDLRRYTVPRCWTPHTQIFSGAPGGRRSERRAQGGNGRRGTASPLWGMAKMEIELPKPLEPDRAADEHKLFCGEVVAEGSPPQLRAASAIAAPSSASPRSPLANEGRRASPTDGIKPIPVSYTHLTLPTNLRV